MKHRTILIAIGIITLLIFLFWPKGSEKQFAQNLGIRLVTIFDEDPAREQGTSPFESKTFIDPEHQLIPKLDPIGFGMGGSMTGSITCEKYESELGVFNGVLGWEATPHFPENGSRTVDYNVHHLKGFLVNTNNDTLYLDYQFKVDYLAKERKSDPSSISLTEGGIKKSGHKIVTFN